MKKKLLIIGASGHGKVVADIAIKMNTWQSIAFLDDNKNVRKCLGLEVIGRSVDFVAYIDEWNFFVAIGDNTIRKKVQEKIQLYGGELVTLIHPAALLGINVTIGRGTVVMAGTVINSDTQIGDGCIINTSSSLDHDNIISDYVHVSPGVRIAGSVNIGESSWVGIGGVVSNNLSICNNCNIGAGTVVLKDIKQRGTYVGIPARKIKVGVLNIEEDFNFSK